MPPSLPDAPRLHELAFHHQPIFDRHARATSYEALVRWPLPDGTIRGPGDFLETMLSDALVESFTRHTLTALATELASRPDVPRLHVNLSPRQLTLAVAQRTLTGLRREVRERLVVELTEQRIPDMDAYGASVRLLTAAGVTVVLDDVEPADLPRRLPRELPVAGVKVDRSVVPELLWAPWGANAAAVRRLAERGLTLTAEGIEDADALEALAALGFDRFQGFGLARPCVSLDEATLLFPGPAAYASHRRVDGDGAYTG